MIYQKRHKQMARRHLMRQFMRELPYIIGTMACFALIGVLLALGI